MGGRHIQRDRRHRRDRQVLRIHRRRALCGRDLRGWGWVALILGALQVLAGLGVLVGNQVACWFAVAVIGLNAIGQMFFIPSYPFWSLMIIALDVAALWGLCAYGSRERLATD